MRIKASCRQQRFRRDSLLVVGLLAVLATSAPSHGFADPASAFVMSDGEKQAFKQARLYGVERRDEFVVWAEAYLAKVAERLARLEAVASPTDTSSLQGFASTLRASRMQLQNLREAENAQWVSRHRVFSETVDDVERLSARLQRRIEPGSAANR